MLCQTLLNAKCAISPLKLKAYLATRSYLFPLTLAPLHDNHRFKTETVQCSAGFGNLAPGISSSSSTSSPLLSTNRGDMAAISNQRASPKTAPAFIWSLNRFQDYFEFRNGQYLNIGHLSRNVLKHSEGQRILVPSATRLKTSLTSSSGHTKTFEFFHWLTRNECAAETKITKL